MVFGKFVGAATVALLLSGTALAQQPIKIGLTGPFTGGSASMGVSMRDGVKLAVAEINKAGGVLGRPLVLVERDDEARNEVGVQVAQARKVAISGRSILTAIHKTAVKGPVGVGVLGLAGQQAEI